uniref:Uncharacterized protein n=1 Tax=Solanum lycopersicum TaxID=4081 RepID=A0A3Q7I8L3_SOLLC
MERDTWNEQHFLTIGLHAKMDCLYCIRGSNLETVLFAIASLCGSISAAATASNFYLELPNSEKQPKAELCKYNRM